mmetsp:Transcript_8866/g.26927  ORF Transcript_8866/g.26927 Transcript_8866/m.26927 type:complete len:82 (-) Transcript_8866:1990-2235(-)
MASLPPSLDVALLQQNHQIAVQELREAVKDVIADTQYDDPLFLLRFVLSAKSDVSAAASNVRATLEWRQAKAEMLQVSGML